MANTDLEIVISAKNEADKVIKKLTDEIRRLQVRLKKLSESKGTDKIKLSVDKTTKSTKRLTEEMKMAKRNADRLARSGRKIEKFDKSIKKASKSAEKLGTNLKASATSSLTAGLSIAAVGAAIGVAIVAANNYTRAIAEISTLVDTSVISHDDLNASVKELSSTYGESLIPTAKALYQAISAGASAGAEANKLMAVAMETAIGGVTTTENAVNGLTTVVNAFGLSMDDAADVSDSMFVAMKGGKTTIAEISSQMFQGASSASVLGVHFSELNAFITALTKQGVPTAQAFTQIRAALVGMIRPAATAGFQKMGYESAKAAIAAHGLAGAMNILVEATGGDTGKLITMIGSVEGLNAALLSTGKSAHFVTEAIDEQANRAGAANEAYNKMTQDVSNSYKIAVNDMRIAVVELGEVMAEAFVPVIEVIGDVAKISGIVIKAFGDMGDTAERFSLSAAQSIGKLFGQSEAAATGFHAKIQELMGNPLDFNLSLIDIVPDVPGISYLANNFGELGEYVDVTNGHIETFNEKLAEFRKEQAKSEKLRGENTLGLGEVKEQIKQLEAIRTEQSEIYSRAKALKDIGGLLGNKTGTEQAKESANSIRTLSEEIITLYGQERVLQEGQELTTAKMKELQETAKRSADAIKVYGAAMRAVADTEFANFSAAAKRAYDDVREASKGTTDTKAVLQAFEVYVRTSISLEQERSRSRIAIAQATLTSLNNLGGLEAADEKRRLASVKEAEARIIDERIAAHKRLYDQINIFIKESEATHRTYLSKVLSLTKELRNLGLSQEFQNADFDRESLTDYEAYISRKEEIDALYYKAKDAAERGDYERVRELNTRRLQLARELRGETIKDAKTGQTQVTSDERRLEAQEALKSIMSERIEFVEQERDANAKLAEQAEAQTKELEKQREIQAQKLKEQQEQKAVDIEATLTPNTEELDARIAELEEGVIVPVTFEEGNRPTGFATGGYINGAGSSTSDSIMARLSDGEYVVRAAAVSKYGRGFFDMINNMQRPSKPHFKEGGSVDNSGGSTVTDTVELILNIGGKKSSVFGARDQIDGLVENMRNLEKALP